MSIKLEKTEVSAERLRRGSGVSSELIIGVRKCYKNGRNLDQVHFMLKNFRDDLHDRSNPGRRHKPPPFRKIPR